MLNNDAHRGRIIDSGFKPARWLRNAHAQTLWQALVPRSAPPPLHKERWELPDGDFLDLAWVNNEHSEGTDSRPIVVLLHGLEGSIRSNYILGLLAAVRQRGWRGCLMQFRNCGDEPNRLARSYHSGETADLDALITRLRGDYPNAPLAAVGYSLGGNVLLNWLGHNGDHAPIDAAVAVSVPMRLDLCASRMEMGFSRLYQRHLVDKLQRSTHRKFHRRDDSPYPLERLTELNSFRRFDHHVTAPLHGFDGVDDYYQRCSSRQYLRGIRVPTLIIHARDDPFMSPEVIPDEAELSPSVTLELSDRGGHVGFVSGRWPWRPRYWLDERIPGFLSNWISGHSRTAS